jgi:YHS domain-containing protein
MFRAIFYLFLTFVVLTVVKSIVGIVLKGFAEAMKPGSAATGAPQRSAGQVPLSGELKKDPVCGTYISAASSIKQTVAGQTVHFCSQDCRDKYVATVAR